MKSSILFVGCAVGSLPTAKVSANWDGSKGQVGDAGGATLTYMLDQAL